MRKYLFSILALLVFSVPLVAGAIEIKPTIGDTTNLADFLNGLINVSVTIILPIAVIIIMIAAFFLATSRGDSEKVSKGKKILTFGLAGLAIVLIGAGSGALFKNIFGIKDIAFEKDITETANLDLQLQMCGTEIEQAKQQLAVAQQSGDKKAVRSLADLIKDAEQKKAEIGEQKQEVDAQSSALRYKYAIAQGIDIYDEQSGRSMLEAYNTKDEQGFYNMTGGGKFNPDIKEYIDNAGKIHTDCTLLYDGTILYK